MKRALRLVASLSVLVLATGSAAPADDLDVFVTTQMEQRHIAGLSLAVIQDGKIVEARAYGVTDRGGNTAVTPTTLFQAGSISKSVAALAALHLVDEHKLDLDADVNGTLKSWKLPSNQFTTKPVTLRGLLSHTAGLTVHGFPGYAIDEKMPTLIQVLDGTPPTNTAAIRVETVPGTRWNYSGGGYTILQQMMIDVSGRPFPQFMRETVLSPLGMTRSSYEQPLPAAMAATTAAGHYQDGSLVRGRWHVYPEMAAAGLWTTPSDLARFAIEVQQANAGKSTRIISEATAHQMLTDQKDNDGLGVFLEGSGHALLFGHNGRDEGFDALLSATVETGQGAAIMINANDDSRMVPRIRAFIASKYHWPNASTYTAPAAVSLPAAQVEAIAGRYELANNQMIALVPRNGHLFTSVGGLPDEEFIPVANGWFASTERNLRFAAARDAFGILTGLAWRPPGNPERNVPRIGPLFPATPDKSIEDPALGRRIEAVVRALGAGGAALSTVSGITEGARHDFTSAWTPAANLVNLVLAGSYDVAGRNIERHGGKVARVLYYRMTTESGLRFLLVHLTAIGLVTDVDLVQE